MYNLMALLHFDELEDFTDDNLPKYPQKGEKKFEKKVEDKIVAENKIDN